MSDVGPVDADIAGADNGFGAEISATLMEAFGRSSQSR
jgi:hypothetical protein